MNDVTVVTSVTYPSPESLALVADVQYHEPYLSAALNRKFRGIVDPGFYAGFLPKPGGGMNLLITSVDGDKTAGAASVDIGEFYQVTIQHRKDISLALNAGKKYAIVLKARYLLGEDTYQVNTASHIHAAEFVARTYTDSYQLGDGELLVCTVNIPAGVSTITQEMIDTSERINRTIGIDISDSVTSTRSDVAASSLAVKKAYDLAKSKHTAQDASTTQKGLVQLSSATNSNSETLAATPKAVKAAYDLAAGKAPASHTHPWNQITGVPSASLTAKGTVQLSSATNSESETEAATPKAVKALHDMLTSKYTGQDATTGRKGIVQLSSATNSNSETLAATPRAVKAAYDLAAGKAPASHTHPWNQITGVPSASLTAKGTVQLSSATNSNSETLAATPRAVKAAYDLAAGKAPASHTHPWNQITGVPSASLTAKGTVQLSSATNSNSETLAATPKAVKAAYDLANSKASAAHTHRWAQITDAPVFSSVARVIMGKQSIKDILDYFGLGEGSTLPVGVPVPWPSSRPPEGWLQCNGAAFTRTKYPKLAVAYPDLRLPDLRGEFIRGWDDLRMIDRGRLLLSTQEATYICTAIQAYHGVAGGADIQAGISFASHDNDIINITPDQPRTGNGILYGRKPVDRWAIARAGKLVSNEKDRWIAIRPRNIAFNYIVRAV